MRLREINRDSLYAAASLLRMTGLLDLCFSVEVYGLTKDLATTAEYAVPGVGAFALSAYCVHLAKKFVDNPNPSPGLGEVINMTPVHDQGEHQPAA